MRGSPPAMRDEFSRCRLASAPHLDEHPGRGSYRKANARLRKMGRPELDVTHSRLSMRPEIEREIDAVVRRCGFRRVVLDGDGGAEALTAWNRSLRLYEKIGEGAAS